MWGDEGVGGPFEDFHALVLVVVGMGVFLASAVTAYLGYVEYNEFLRFQRDAFEALDRIVGHEPVLHEGVRGLFDVTRLNFLNDSALRMLVGGYGFRLLLTDPAGIVWVDIASGPASERQRSALTTVAVWSSDTLVWTARLSLIVWRD